MINSNRQADKVGGDSRWLVKGLLVLLISWPACASAQFTAVTRPDACRMTVLQNPSVANPLRVQAGLSEIELWLDPDGASLDLRALSNQTWTSAALTATVLATRTARSNISRACPAQVSVVLKLEASESTVTESTSRLELPAVKGAAHSLGITVVPHPPVSWTWEQAPLVEPPGGCVLLPHAGFAYSAGDVLQFIYPAGTRPLLSTCTAHTKSLLRAANINAHIKQPVPVRIISRMVLGGGPSMQPELGTPSAISGAVQASLDTAHTSQLSGPGATLPVTIRFMHVDLVNGAPGTFALEVQTPNQHRDTLDLQVDVPKTPVFRAPIAIEPKVEAGASLKFRLEIAPPAGPSGHTVTWRVTSGGRPSSRCFGQGSGTTPFDTAREFQSFRFMPGQATADLAVVVVGAPGCAPAVHSLEAWSSSAPPGRAPPFYVGPSEFKVTVP